MLGRCELTSTVVPLNSTIFLEARFLFAPHTFKLWHFNPVEHHTTYLLSQSWIAFPFYWLIDYALAN